MKTLSFTEPFLFRVNIVTDNVDHLMRELTYHAYAARVEQLVTPNRFVLEVPVDNYVHAAIFIELLSSFPAQIG